jgi:hypothetical protein
LQPAMQPAPAVPVRFTDQRQPSPPGPSQPNQSGGAAGHSGRIFSRMFDLTPPQLAPDVTADRQSVGCRGSGAWTEQRN